MRPRRGSETRSFAYTHSPARHPKPCKHSLEEERLLAPHRRGSIYRNGIGQWLDSCEQLWLDFG